MPVTSTRRAIVRVAVPAESSTVPPRRPGAEPRLPAGPVGDDVAVEAPLTLVLRDEPMATLMRTPGHDLELAAGWLLVESGVRDRHDIARLHQSRDAQRVLITLADGVTAPRPRAFVTSTSCGVCSADVVDTALERRWQRRGDITVRRDVVAGLPDAMKRAQRGFARTGGVHAAALARVTGELLVVREDVGRHNAVDKAAGWALLDGRIPASELLLVVSGRVSFEIVQKAVAAGVSGIVAVSAPTSLAVDLAVEHGLLLAAMVRGGRMNLYSRPDSVLD